MALTGLLANTAKIASRFAGAVLVSRRDTDVSQAVPGSMVGGNSYSVSIAMANTGTTTWTSGNGTPPVRLGAQNPQDNSTWGPNRVDVPLTVTPGKQVSFTTSVRAPSSPGTYNFQWRMVEEGVIWFGEMTPNVQVAVAKGKETKDGKEQKDKEKEKERDKLALIENATPGTTSMTPQPVQDEQESGAQTASGTAFIPAEERPAVGGQATGGQAGEEQ